MICSPVDDPKEGCAHCGLPIPAGRFTTDAPAFCCTGCDAVYHFLRAQGLDEYYRLRELKVAETQPATPSGRSFPEFDHDDFHLRYLNVGEDSTSSIELYLDGVHCAGCMWLVEKLPALVDGVHHSRLNMANSVARIEFEAGKVKLSEIARTLDRLGYTPHPYHRSEADRLRRAEERREWIRIAVAFAATGNVMLMAAALYSGEASGIDQGVRTFFRWASLAVSIPALLFCARPFLRGAWSSFRLRRPHMDLPISVGLVTGFFFSALHTIRGAGEIYFDSLLTLVLLLLVGRYLERRQQRRASDASKMRHTLCPRHARRLETLSSSGADRIEEVAVASLVIGDLVEVRAGESIPVDGEIVSGESHVDESWLSGESRPRAVQIGSEVSAGTANLSKTFIVRTSQTGADSRIGRLVERVLEGSRSTPSIQRADRLAGWFVIAVLLLAAVGFLLGFEISAQDALDRAIAVLVISCPCALGLATPLAVAAATGQAARAGILIKNTDTFDLLQRPLTFFFDKTGTLTEGRLRVVDWIGDSEIKPIIAAIERHSSHPVASALVEFGSDRQPEANSENPKVSADDHRAATVPRDAVQTALGGGVEACVDGEHYRIGSLSFLSRFGHCTPPTMTPIIEDATAAGHTPIGIVVDGRFRALVILGDRLRHDSRDVLSTLRGMGHRTMLLSGDHPETVSAVGTALGFGPEEIVGGASPEDKERILRDYRHRHVPVAMVGDGVNDAWALLEADVGFAIRGGAEASLSAADIYATGEGLKPLVAALEGSRRTLAVIRRNHLISLAYNTVGVSLALAGIVGPLLAAVLMPLSSITVVTHSYRSPTFGPRR